MKKNSVMTIVNVPSLEKVQAPIITRDYLDTLEEQLYIWWELRPMTRMWKAELVQTGVAAFVYASEDPVLVRWVGDLAYTVEVCGA